MNMKMWLLLAVVALLLVGGADAKKRRKKRTKEEKAEDEEKAKPGGPADPYCENEDCYAELGEHLGPESTPREVKKAYRALSLKFHPDKNKSPEGKARFIKIGRAYEVLDDPIRKKGFDYYRDHPDERTWGRGVFWKLPEKSDFRVVLACLVVALSIVQYVIQGQKHISAIVEWKKDAKRKLAARATVTARKTEENKGKDSKNRKSVKVTEEEIKAQLDVDARPFAASLAGTGYAPASPMDTFIVNVWFYPFTLGIPAIKGGIWYARRAGGVAFSDSERAVVTYTELGLTSAEWDALDAEDKEEQLGFELWVPAKKEEWENSGLESLKKTDFKKYKKIVRDRKKAAQNKTPGNYND
jgi:hypothetical protein